MLSLQAQALKPEGTFPCNLRAAQSDNQAKKRRNVDDISSYQIRIPKFPSSHFAVSARRSKLEGLVFVNFTEMGSKRLNSKASVSSSSSCSSPAPKLSEPESGVKGTVGQDEILEIDSDKVEKMTIQQLRVNLRSVGIPAKGSKNDLVSAWKSFMNSQVNGKGSLELEDHVSSQKKQNENNPESKAGGLSSGEHFQGKTSVSEVSKLKGTKRKVKEGILGDNKVEIRTMQFGTQQGQSVEYFASKGKKSIQTKRKVSYATAVLHGRRNGEDEGDTRGKTIFPQMAKNSKTSPEIREMVQRMFELKKQVEGCITTMISWLQDRPDVMMGDATCVNNLKGTGTSKTANSLVQPTSAHIHKELDLGTVQAQAKYHTSQVPQTQIANWTQPNPQLTKFHIPKQPLKQSLKPKPVFPYSHQAQSSKQNQPTYLTLNPTDNNTKPTTHNPNPSPTENNLNPKQTITCYPNPYLTLPNPKLILPHNPNPVPTSTPTRKLNQRNRNQDNKFPREELSRLGSEPPLLAGPVTENKKCTGVEASESLDSSGEPWTILAHKNPQKEWVAYNPRTMRPPPLAGDIEHVKLMSWNVNGLRSLLKLKSFSVLQLAQREDFDVLCLQETKLQEKDVEAIKQTLLEDYDHSFWTCSVSKLGYSGTAIISRIKPLSVRYGLGISDHDTEGRLVTAEFDNFYLLSGYVPNSGDGLKRLSYRITQWDPSFGNYLKDLEKSKPVILTGDLNCAHEEIDIYNPAGNKRSAGFTAEERQSFETNFLSKGLVDTFRRQHPGVVGYTYWGYRHGGRKTNKGWRLDYFLVSECIADKVHDSYILPDVTGSDHSPIGLILKL